MNGGFAASVPGRKLSFIQGLIHSIAGIVHFGFCPEGYGRFYLFFGCHTAFAIGVVHRLILGFIYSHFAQV